MTAAVSIPTIYLPRTGEAAAEPAPYVLDEAETMRLLRIESDDPYQVLYRYRQKGLKATQVGKALRYLLPDVLRFLEVLKEENPR